LTLYEVVLALSIFLGAMLVLSRLIATGSQAAIQAQLRTAAILACQTKMSEVVSGVLPLQSTQGESLYEDDANWTWDLAIESVPEPGLLLAKVTVARQANGETAAVEYSLTRLIRDPAAFLDSESEDEDENDSSASLPQSAGRR
jgi:type II secretion system protein I